MSNSVEKKRYWLKLDKNFLKSTHIKVIKDMPNGRDYIIFYLSLMLESIETIGHLRFSDLVPYNNAMLASVTETNIDIVRSAIELFIQLGLVEVLDDGTLYLTQVAQMTGKESESAERVRQYRLRKKEALLLQCNENVTDCNDNKEKKEDKELEEYQQDTDNNLEEKEKKLKSVCDNTRASDFCHLGSLFKSESCISCMKKLKCPNPVSSSFEIAHNCTFEEYVDKIEALYKSWVEERNNKGLSTDFQYFDYDYLNEDNYDY